MLQEKPDFLKRFLRARSQANKYFLEREKEASELLANIWKSDYKIANDSYRASKAAFTGSGIAQGASRRDTGKLMWRALAGVAPSRVDFDVMCIPTVYRGLPLPVGGFARILAPLGVPVHVWTVDDARQAGRLRRIGVRGIISNDPAAMLA